MTKKLVINSNEQPFGLSPLQCRELLEIAGYEYYEGRDGFQQGNKDLDPEEAALEQQGYEKSQRLLNNIRFLLGVYPDLKRNIDKRPTSKEIAKTFDILQELASEFYSILSRLDQHSRAELRNKKIEIGSLMEVIGSFEFQSKRIVMENEDIETRGAKHMGAREILIDHLADCYERYSLEPSYAAKTEFITLALGYAGIPHPLNIKRLLSAPRKKRFIISQRQ